MKLVKICNKIIASVLFAGYLLTVNDVSAAMRHFSVDGDHGKLRAILQYPDKESYPLVILMHGFGANKYALSYTADKLEEKGIASVRFDFNGHGESEGRFEDMTVLNEVEDARKIYEYLSKQPQITSISLAGHSQGGLVASLLAGELGEDKIKSLVLLAAFFNFHDMIVQGNLFGIKFDLNNLPDFIEIPGFYKVGKKYLETARDLQPLDIAFKYRGPVLLIHCEGDEVVPVSYSDYYNRRYANSDLFRLDGDNKCNHLYQGYEQVVREKIADFIADKVFEKEKHQD